MSLALILKSGIRPCFCDERRVVRPDRCPCSLGREIILPQYILVFCCKMGLMTPWRPLFFREKVDNKAEGSPCVFFWRQKSGDRVFQKPRTRMLQSF